MSASATSIRTGRVLTLISAGHFMSHFWSITLPALFPVLAVVFGVSFVQLGALVTIFSVTNAVAQMPFGYAVDRHGAKPILVGGLLVSGVVFSLASVAPGYWALVVLMIIAGVSQAVFHPADYALLSTMYPAERAGKPYSLHTFSGFAGSAAAPLLLALLERLFNWQVALLFSGLVGIAIGLVMLVMLEVPEPVRVAKPSGAPARRTGGVGWRLFVGETFVLLFLFFVFTSMASTGLSSFLPSTLTELYDVSVDKANSVLTVYLGVLAVGVLLGGVIADRVQNHARVIAVTFTIGVALMFLVALVRMPLWMLLPIFAVSGGLQGVIAPSRDKMVREAAPEDAAGKAFAFVSVGLSVGGIIAPLILGAILDENRPTLVFWVLAVFLAVATVTVLIPALPWRQRAAEADEPVPVERGIKG